MQTFEEFKTSLTTSHKGKFKITGSWGIYDSFKHIRKNGWYNIGRPLKEHEFYTVIRSINNYLAKELTMGNTVQFPYKLGKLELRKSHRGVSFVDNKLKVTYPVDWYETLKLWYKDSEARENKTLIRHENNWVYRVKYNKWNATFNNKIFYEFCLNRFIKRALTKNIKDKKIDALW